MAFVLSVGCWGVGGVLQAWISIWRPAAKPVPHSLPAPCDVAKPPEVVRRLAASKKLVLIGRRGAAGCGDGMLGNTCDSQACVLGPEGWDFSTSIARGPSSFSNEVGKCEFATIEVTGFKVYCCIDIVKPGHDSLCGRHDLTLIPGRLQLPSHILCQPLPRSSCFIHFGLEARGPSICGIQRHYRFGVS